MKKTKEEIQEDLPFDIDAASDKIVMDIHGIDQEEIDEMMESFIKEMDYHAKLSEKRVGTCMRAAALQRGVETSQGPKDIILYVYIENIGKLYEKDEDNKLEGLLMKIEIVEVDEVTDNYLDFMTVVKNINKENESKEFT